VLLPRLSTTATDQIVGHHPGHTSFTSVGAVTRTRSPQMRVEYKWDKDKKHVQPCIVPPNNQAKSRKTRRRSGDDSWRRSYKMSPIFPRYSVEARVAQLARCACCIARSLISAMDMSSKGLRGFLSCAADAAPIFLRRSRGHVELGFINRRRW